MGHETLYVPEVTLEYHGEDDDGGLKSYAATAKARLASGVLAEFGDEDSLQRLMDCVAAELITSEEFHLITGMVA